MRYGAYAEYVCCVVSCEEKGYGVGYCLIVYIYIFFSSYFLHRIYSLLKRTLLVILNTEIRGKKSCCAGLGEARGLCISWPIDCEGCSWFSLSCMIIIKGFEAIV